jgi:diguanylate cyclase (GGDEF)-like protein
VKDSEETIGLVEVQAVPTVQAHGVGSQLSEQSSLQPANLALHLTAVLQTSLDPGHLIERFAREIRHIIPHDGIIFRNKEQDLEISLGESSAHSCSYRLVVEEEVIGHLDLQRKSPFPTAEVSLLEYLLCSLVYPLRNALEYRRATENARKDPLTGVYNRGVMETLMHREIGLAHRHRTPLSLIFMDIDHFKYVNDDYGHAIGDRVIKAIADCVVRMIRATDILARYGGDEFVLLLSNTPRDGALLLAERIRAAVEKDATLMAIIEYDRKITTSIGVAALTEQESFDQLCERADQSLNLAKHSGRNCVRG